MNRWLPEPQNFDFRTNDGLPLRLRRYPNRGPAVLLIHGASAASNTFVLGDLERGKAWNNDDLKPLSGGLGPWLHQNDCELWTLDWRGSHRVAEGHVEPHFTLDQAAEDDIPTAIQTALRISNRPLSVLAHCFGAGAFSLAAARGKVPDGVEQVVLTTLGLFYVVPAVTWFQAEDQYLETLRKTEHPVIDPGRPDSWPQGLGEMLQTWRRVGPRCPKEDDLCNRVRFMFGKPFDEDSLLPGIHERLGGYFGAMPLELYVHAGQNVRRGWAARFEAPTDNIADLNPLAFDRFRLTLLTGANNGLWNADSLGRMNEWLWRHGLRRQQHLLLPGYAHQDLLWGKNAATDVYPQILEALAGRVMHPALQAV